MKVNNNVKPGLSSLLFTLIPTIILAFLLFIGVASDSSGEPETGWGALLAVLLLGPPLLIFGLLTIWRFIRYKQLNSKDVNSTDNTPVDKSSGGKPPAVVG